MPNLVSGECYPQKAVAPCDIAGRVEDELDRINIILYCLFPIRVVIEQFTI
jgi:hypothetical protein